MKAQGNLVKLSQKTEIMEAWFFTKATENSFWSLYFASYWSSKDAIFFLLSHMRCSNLYYSWVCLLVARVVYSNKAII